jgi:hypothetical protein
MIKKLSYKNKEYSPIVVHECPKDILPKIKNIDLKLEGCTVNSYKIAKKVNCQMIEGFLVTVFSNKKEIECVGHVWNLLNDTHFDMSITIIDREHVKENFYFPILEYNPADALIKDKYKFGIPISFEKNWRRNSF